MPGIFPSRASSRKQIRQRLKSRKNPRGRPHLKQRRTTRLLNFGFLCAFTIIDVFAICIYACSPKEKLEAPASRPCGSRLRKLLRVTLFFVQPVVEKQSPQRGLENIREMRSKVKRMYGSTTFGTPQLITSSHSTATVQACPAIRAGVRCCTTGASQSSSR